MNIKLLAGIVLDVRAGMREKGVLANVASFTYPPSPSEMTYFLCVMRFCCIIRPIEIMTKHLWVTCPFQKGIKKVGVLFDMYYANYAEKL